MDTQRIRECFLGFFESNGHKKVDSSSLVPAQDKTLLFTNAGMVQFKDYFTGESTPPYEAATSVQRCLRAGGKHNDLNNVGFTSRHHTFFEMLGNFSFGSYFKEEAIAFAWDLLTNEFGIPREKLLVTVYKDDDEAAKIWRKKINVSEDRIIKCGEKDNFWAMGDTGPCGPCTEIFYDHGPNIEGGPPGSPNENGDRFVEIWNLVFMQYLMDSTGAKNPLPKPAVDTGMGLERIAAVLQNVTGNYEIDLFKKLNNAVINSLGNNVGDIAIQRIISDHIRAATFLVMDGVVPGNEGRGYVLRRIIRRALRYGRKVNDKSQFFYLLVSPLTDIMGESYPDLREKQDHITYILKTEEERFTEALGRGLSILDKRIKQNTTGTLEGEIVFELYDTYGFPIDITTDIAKEQGLGIDTVGFEKLMENQKLLAKSASKFGKEEGFQGLLKSTFDSDEFTQRFCGYTKRQNVSKVVSIYYEGVKTNKILKNQLGVICIEETPFYAEAGGQIGDIGIIKSQGGVFEVRDTKVINNVFIHIGEQVEGELQQGEKVEAAINIESRIKTTIHHSATHLLHAALRCELGKGVGQKGSYVAANRMRFDFSHPEAVSDSQLQKIERLVNSKIRENLEVETKIMEISDAINSGAIAFFDEKYSDKVRVLSMGNFSAELCGGTHVSQTGELGFFKILSESSIGSGTRRIEALCGIEAERHASNIEKLVRTISSTLETPEVKILDKLGLLIEEKSNLERELKKYKESSLDDIVNDVYERAEEINNIKFVFAKLDNVEPKELRRLADNLKNRPTANGIIVILASSLGKKLRLVVGVSKKLSNNISAVELINYMVKQDGGKGGGRSDLAQAGGEFISEFKDLIEFGRDWITENI